MRHPEQQDWRQGDKPENLELLAPLAAISLTHACEVSKLKYDARKCQEMPEEPDIMVTWATRTSRMRGKAVVDIVDIVNNLL